MNFVKMHGLGNDFIITREKFAGNVKNLNNFAQKICDRHLGIGADGLVLLCPSNKADIKMKIFNSDGTQAEMCGNGMRCIAKYAYEKEIVSKKIFKIETTSGTLHQAIYLGEKGTKKNEIEIEIGKPLLLPDQIPVDLVKSGPILKEPLNVNGKTFHISCISVGNPHCVIFEKNLKNIPLAEIGPLIENHPIFPQKTNVEFAKIIDSKNISMIVWERGSGRTLACGSGACAVTIAGVLNDLCERSVMVHLEGGILKVNWREDDIICLRGPCEEVFEGEVNIENFSNL